MKYKKIIICLITLFVIVLGLGGYFTVSNLNLQLKKQNSTNSNKNLIKTGDLPGYSLTGSDNFFVQEINLNDYHLSLQNTSEVINREFFQPQSIDELVKANQSEYGGNVVSFVNAGFFEDISGIPTKLSFSSRQGFIPKFEYISSIDTYPNPNGQKILICYQNQCKIEPYKGKDDPQFKEAEFGFVSLDPETISASKDSGLNRTFVAITSSKPNVIYIITGVAKTQGEMIEKAKSYRADNFLMLDGGPSSALYSNYNKKALLENRTKIPQILKVLKN